MRKFYSILMILFISAALFADDFSPSGGEFPFLEPETISDLEEGRTSINIRSNIRDAAVYLNGNFEGKVSLKLKDIMRGQYHLRLARRGYESKDYTIEVTAGCAQEYYIELTPQKAE